MYKLMVFYNKINVETSTEIGKFALKFKEGGMFYVK
jgi:hypothetical protein